MPELLGLERAQRPQHLPAVLSRREGNLVLDHLHPSFRLVAHLLHGSGLRLSECLSIRLKDADLDRRQIMARRGKGDGGKRRRDRAVVAPGVQRIEAGTANPASTPPSASPSP